MLAKGGRLGNDPNIGQLTIIAAVLRQLGWCGEIEITQHGLEQPMVKKRNKFVYLANFLDIGLEGLIVPSSAPPGQYWEYEMKGEKMVTIFLHLLIEYLSQGFVTYSNHAGSERGYFLTRDGQQITVEKYTDKKAYKAGDKTAVVNLPDLIIYDDKNNEIINIEGEQFCNVLKGIEQLNLFGAIEKKYVDKHYAGLPITRTVVLFGGDTSAFRYVEVSFILTYQGSIEISLDNAPEIFKTATANLRDFYKSPDSA